MAGKPETAQRPGATSNSALHNVLVYVSGDGFGYAPAPHQSDPGAMVGPGGGGIVYPAAISTAGVKQVPVAAAKVSAPSLQTLYANLNGFQNVTAGGGGVHSEHAYPGAQTLIRNHPTPQNAFAVKAATGREDGSGGGNFVAVMGGEVVFPRCDSVRSETAESSCSSLSSSCGDSQPPIQDVAGSAVNTNTNAQRGASSDNSNSSAGAVVASGANVQQQFKPQQQETASISIPAGWKRLHTNGIVIYVSPSNTALSSLDQVKAYLQTQGTCKCGLECPLNCDVVFNFDPKVATRSWSAGAPPNDLTRLCNHKRKALSLPPHPLAAQQQDIKKLDAAVRRKKRKMGIGVGQLHQYGGNASVSQLLAQRERERNTKDATQSQKWNDGSLQAVPDGSSPVTVQNHMIVNPAINRVQYPPGYHENNSNHSGNLQIGQPPPPQYFRYNPVGCTMNNCSPGNQQNLGPGMIDSNGQVVCTNQNNPNSGTIPFSSANSNVFSHPPHVVMATSMGTCNNQEAGAVPIQNGNNGMLIQQQNNCGPATGPHMMISGHQHVQNFMVQQHQHQQQRIHVASSENGDISQQHSQCNQGSKPQLQPQVFMQQHENVNLMNHIQQQQIHQQNQHQQLQQQHIQQQQQQLQQQQQQQQQQHQIQQQQQQQQQQQIQQQQHHHHHHHHHQSQNQQQLQQHQLQQHQHQLQQQHHPNSVPVHHNLVNASSTSRPPSSTTINQPIQNMVSSQQHIDSIRMTSQFHNQQQQHQVVHSPHDQGKNLQLVQPQHVHVVNGTKVNCNQQQCSKTNIGVNNGSTQVLVATGLNNRGIVCDNGYSAIQTSRSDDLQHQQHPPSTTMILQTSQGQVMIPPGQAISAPMLVHNQPGNHAGPSAQQVHTMNIQGSTMVVQGTPGTATVLPTPGHAINSQGQTTMVLQQGQHGHPLISQQGLQVQTVVGNQQHGGVTLQHGAHHHQQQQQQQLSSNHQQLTSSCNSTIPAGSGIVTHHQRPAPPWQQNRQHQNQMSQHQNLNTVISPQQQPQHIVHQQSNPYERVPPLHHHSQHIPVWQQQHEESSVKKKPAKIQSKTTLVKKQRSPYNVEHHHNNMVANNNDHCPNVDVRNLQDQKNQQQQNYSNSNVPSFMEDPSGYLAQQTALLNSTISRQTGNGANIICHSPCGNQNQNMPEQNSSGQIVINLPTSACSPIGNQGVPLPSNVLISTNKQNHGQQQTFTVRNNQPPNTVKVYRSNSVSSTGSVSYHNKQQSQPGTPDSSDVSPERNRCSQQGCASSNNSNVNNSNVFESNIQPGTVHLVHNAKQMQADENPVTSSTFIENRGQNHPVSMSTPDSRGPIQGGTVSTSNRSPVEAVHRIPPPDTASPVGPSTPTSSSMPNCRLVNSPESSTVSNILVSVSSPFTNSLGNQVIFTSHPNQNITLTRNHDQSSRQQQQLNINFHVQDVATSRMPAVVTTMASGHTVSSNTITSVLAGRANTATVSVNNPTTISAHTIPSTVLTNQPVSQVSVTKSPLEMVQSVVSSIQVPSVSTGQTETAVLKQTSGPNLPAGHILVSSNGQLIVANTSGGPPAILSPQQGLTKIGGNSPMPPMSGSSIVTTVTGAVTQMIPSIGVTQQVLGQPTVLVNTLPAPLLFQPGVMTVDGTMNAVQIPHLAVATNNAMLQQGQMVDDSRVAQSGNGAFSPRGQPALLSPESANSKRKANIKKRKVSPQTVANMLHIASQQNSPTAGATGMVVQQSQPQQNFGNSAPMLQALTILPSKAGHFGGTQQLIATANVLQPLNLVQNFPTIQQFIVPAGLGGMVMATGDGTATLLQDAVQLNVLTPMQGPGGTVFGHAGGQSILTAGPAGMVIRAPANNNQNTAKVQHVTSGTGPQFIANSPNQFLMNNPAAFSGQLSPMLASVSPNNQPIHSFHSPGAANQNRNGQAHQEFIQCGQTLMVPCTIAQAPSAQNTTVVQQNTTIVQQQTTMVSNNQQSVDQNQGPATSTSSSLSLNQHNFILNNSDGKQPQNFIITTDKQNQGNFILSPNPDNKHPGTHIILNNISPTTDKQSQQCSGFLISQSTDKSTGQICDNFILTNSSIHSSEKSTGNFIISSAAAPNVTQQTEKQSKFAKHSVSTQTAANQQILSAPTPVALIVATTNTFCQTSTSTSYSGSPPDTTTHSPIDAGGSSQSPGLITEVPSSSVTIGSTDENLSSPTSSSDPTGRSQPMVHCVSSSNEQDSPEWPGKEVTMSPGPAIFSPPPNLDASYNRGGNGAMKTVSVNSYVESSSTMQQFEGERLHKHSTDESLSRQIYHQYHRIESCRAPKRKHSQLCSDNDARIHTSTLSPQDDDDDSGSFSGSGSETEGGDGDGPPGPGAGDLVWGAARGFPSWPGKLVGPAPTPGRVWVRWFGGASPLSEVDPQDLKTLSEGLEAHHRARKKFRKSRKLNSQLENAIQEAMAELDRMSETPQQGPPVPPQPLNESLAALDSSGGRTRRAHR